jgi:hypothetical protein
MNRRQVAQALALAIGVLTLSGCGIFGREAPTRTPVPTFTPTPIVAGAAAVTPAATQPPLPNLTPVVTVETPTLTPTPVPPTPTETPSPAPSPTPQPSPSPTPTLVPTATPAPSPTPALRFDLELAEKHPTESLAPNVVRIYLYVYSPRDFALPGYSLRVTHNGAELPVDVQSTGGLPELTRSEPGPYSRFTNMNVIFVEAQAGTWVVQLVDAEGNVAGPPATFELTASEETRELYTRYRLK